MTTRTNLMSTLAVTLGLVAILAIGSVTTSLADSNDGGPLNKAPSGDASAGSYAPVYSQTTASRRAMQTSNSPTVDAYDSFGRYLGSIPRRSNR